MGNDTVQFIGLKEAQDAAVRLIGNMKKLRYDTIVHAAQLIKNDAYSNVEKMDKVDTGKLRDSIDFDVTVSGDTVSAIIGPHQGSGPDPGIVAEVIEFGRRPGATPPPPDALLPWMARHGFPPEAKFALSKKIGREGLAGQPFPYMRNALEANRRKIEQIFETIGEKIDLQFRW